MSNEQQQRPYQEIAPAAKWSEHQAGETIQFFDAQDLLQRGEIVYVIAPREIAGKPYPLTYAVDTGHGFPDMVPFTDVIEDLAQDTGLNAVRENI